MNSTQYRQDQPEL